MEMVAHDPKAAKRVGIPQSVGQDFAKADEGKHFSAHKEKAKAQALRKPKLPPGMEGMQGEEGAL